MGNEIKQNGGGSTRLHRKWEQAVDFSAGQTLS